MIKLRDYQLKFKSAIYAAWETARVVLGVLPTGGGKTITFSSIISEHKGASIIVVHRREILSQISVSLALISEDLAEKGVCHRVIAPTSTIAMIRRKHLARFGKSFIDPSAQTAVASVQTLTSASSMKNPRLQAFIAQVTLAVFDEGHHYIETGFWARAVNLFDRAKILLVTATPERADGVGLGKGEGGFAEVMVEGPTVKELMEHGNLCPYVYYCPESDADFSGIAVNKDGDLNTAAMRARVVESHLVGDLVSHYRQFADGMQGIVFVDSIATANDCAAAFNAAGVSALALSGETDDGERERAISAYERGEVRLLINMDLFDEGFDVPQAQVCIGARPTMSLIKYMQQNGRVLRPAEGKTHAVIIDPVRNWERHGQVTWPRVWSLKGKDKADRENSDTPKQRACLSCSQPYEAFRTECPYCHAVPVPPERTLPEHTDGDLFALDLEALEAMFRARNKANITEDEFQQSLFARKVPPIGHGQQIRRFRATKYRRDVLHNLIGWWVGAQPPGRSTREIQKRFYLRFGIDMVLVSALDLNETEDMIEKIARLFDKDLVA